MSENEETAKEPSLHHSKKMNTFLAGKNFPT
jgi:hypothetical protein